MMITKHGRHEVIDLGCLCLAMAAGIWYLGDNYSPAWYALWAVPLVLFGWVLWFFRDPDRKTPDGEGLFISPADGVIADITPLGPDGKLKRDGVQIGVFMNVFNVHVNRMPCDAEIMNIIHKPGTFMDVRDPASFEKNESTTLTLSYEHNGEKYPVLVRQIAGLVARRIVTAVEDGDVLKRGQRFGMIKFGSRLEVYLPRELAGKICVKLGQKVFAGETVLAKIFK